MALPINLGKKLWLVALLISTAQVCGSPATQQVPQPQPPAKPVHLEPFYRVFDNSGKERLLAGTNLNSEKLKSQESTKLFCAVRSERWPAGLVPVFQVAEGKNFVLKRLPVSGEENSSEPLFFALPLEDDSEATKLCGHWDFRAVQNGSTSLTALEITYLRGEVSARFDQNSDYGFAHLSNGTFQNNELMLTVRYIADVYLVKGKLENGILTGKWTAQSESEHGTWQASRAPQNLPPPSNAVSLFEWTRPSDGALRYATEDESMSTEWVRTPIPLCRVWRIQE